MDLIKIENSSNIAAVGYDHSTFTLTVQFHSGGIYQYFPVTQFAYEELMKAESKGSFVNKNLVKNPQVNCIKKG